MSRVVVLSIACALLSAAPSAAQNGISDAFCNTMPFWTGDTLYWRVSTAALTAALNTAQGSTVLQGRDVEDAVDTVLQKWSRHSRARTRMRVIKPSTPDVCSALDISTPFSPGANDPCITAHSNGESNLCLDNPTSLAWAGCDPLFGCKVHFCSDNIALPGTIDFGDGDFDLILSHELGHTFGLDHVNGLGTCAPSSTADACEGELMCANLGNIVGLTNGDIRGFRQRVSGQQTPMDRDVWFSTRTTTGAPSLTKSAFNASFAPRIACSAFENTIATCAALINDMNGTTPRTRVLALSTPNTSGGWGSVDTVTTSASFVALPGDIAISPYGDVAYYTRVSTTNNNASVEHVDLTTGSRTSATLGYSSVLPVRVAFNDDINGAIVIGAQRNASGAPTWRMHKAVFNAGVLTVTPLNFGTLDDFRAEGSERPIVADFDFDCRVQLIGSSPCVLVATLYDDQRVDSVGRLYSRRFSVFGNAVTVSDAQWQSSALRSANAVIGVSLSSTQMFLSVGIQGSGSSNNTRRLVYPGLDVSVAPTSNVAMRSDAVACATATSTGNFSMGASTPHGGFSQAYCPTCLGGRLQGLHLGLREDGDDFCF